MRKTLDELSKDTLAQRVCLRLEASPSLTVNMNKDKGKVFDYKSVEDGADRETSRAEYEPGFDNKKEGEVGENYGIMAANIGMQPTMNQNGARTFKPPLVMPSF